MLTTTIFSLLIAWLNLVFALPATSEDHSIPKFENITISPTSDRIQYYPTCTSKSFPACQGSWYKIRDTRFSSGEAMVSTGRSLAFGDQDPYLVLYFKGSAMHMYQWVNSTTLYQSRMTDTEAGVALDLKAEHPPDPNNPSELRRVLAWKIDNLDPTKTHMIGLQLPYSSTQGNGQVIIDQIVITRLVGTIDGEEKPNENRGAKIGGAVGGTVAGLVLIAGVGYFHIRLRRAREAARRQYAWEGTNGGITQKFTVDPSAEIAQSEQIAQNGRVEDQKNSSKDSPPMPTLPHIS